MMMTGIASLFFFNSCKTTQSITTQENQGKKLTRPFKDKNSKGNVERKVRPFRSKEFIGDFPIVRNKEVNFWISYFQKKGRRSFSIWSKRGAPFKSIIEETLESEGLPRSLFYVSFIESGFNLSARSHAKAVGPWQFMKSTGEQYGLRANYWVDPRQDLVKSTQAAATYLKHLKDRFGDWYLALAAYNAGPGNLRKAMRKTGIKDFWKLRRTRYLKKETADFVPKIIASIIIGNKPTKYGFQVHPKGSFEEYPESLVLIRKPVTLVELSRKLSVPVKKLRRWNPELLRDMTPPMKKGQVYQLRVGETHLRTFARVKNNLNYHGFGKGRVHKVAEGDTLSKIAKKYKVSLKTLMAINPNLSTRHLAIGAKVFMPATRKKI